MALEGTRAATCALGCLMFNAGPPADGFVERMTEWFAGTPDGPPLTGVCKEHAYAPYVAACGQFMCNSMRCCASTGSARCKE